MKFNRIVITLVCSVAMASNAQTTMGDYTCNEWVTKPSDVKKAWLMGSLTGMNIIHELAYLKPEDPLKLMPSIDWAVTFAVSYCQANPNKNLSFAAYMLFQEMKRKSQ